MSDGYNTQDNREAPPGQEQPEEQTHTQETVNEEKQQPEQDKKQTDAQRLLDDGRRLLDDSKKMLGDSKEVIAENLKYYMKKMQVTSSEVCKDLGIRVSTFSDWLNQKSFPRIEKIDALAEYFGIKKSDLIEVRPERPGSNSDAAQAEDTEIKATILTEVEVPPEGVQQMAMAIAGSYGAYLKQKTEPDIARVQDLAYKLLLAQAEATFPMDLRTLKYEQKIVFENYEDYQQSTGMEIDLKLFPVSLTTWIAAYETYLVLYRKDLLTVARNWVLAQELAHILLNHQDPAALTEKQQKETELFALELLMPSPVVAALTAKGVAMEQGVLRDIFQVAGPAAEKRCSGWGNQQVKAESALASQVAERYAAWVTLVSLQ